MTPEETAAMNSLVPKDPAGVTVFRKVSPSILTFSAPFARFGRIKMGGRGTVVKLPSGALAVFSPLALTPTAKSTVEEMGTVKYLAALDFEVRASRSGHANIYD